MNIIPHPETLKKKERELVEIEIELSKKDYRLQLLEDRARSLIRENIEKKKRMVTTCAIIFFIGFAAGFSISLFST